MNSFEHYHLVESRHQSLSMINPLFSLRQIDSNSIELLMLLPNLLTTPQCWLEVLPLIFDLLHNREKVVRCEALFLLLNLLRVHYECLIAKTLKTNQENQSLVFLQFEREVILFGQMCRSNTDSYSVREIIVKIKNQSHMNLLYIGKQGG